MEESYPHEKLTPKQWLSNIWYYYKWIILTVFVFLIFASICIVQYFSAKEYDGAILYVGSQNLPISTVESIKESMKNVIQDDYNSDNEKSVDIKNIVLASNFDKLLEKNPDADYQFEALKEYNNELLAGEFCIMLLDPYFYDQMANDKVIEYIPVLGGYGIPLKELAIYKLDGFSELPDDTVLCFKKVGSESRLSDDEKNEAYERNFLVLQDMILFE